MLTMHISYAVLAVLPVVVWLLYTQLYNWRFRKFAHIPQYFPRLLFLGHLKSIGAGLERLGDTRRHPGKFASIDYVGGLFVG